MESNAYFQIPMNSCTTDSHTSATALVDAVEITSEPSFEIKTNIDSKMTNTLYEELSAISEEVIACRNSALNRA